MKTLQFICFLLLLASFQNTYAQHSFSGKVVDESGNPIFFATVGLYQTQDTILAKAISTDDQGKYLIENVKSGEYFLEISMLGYNNFIIDNINFPAANGRQFDAELSEATELVEGVTIKARVPLLEQRSDRLIVNVANNVASLNNSLLDVMKKVPGMIVTGDKLRMAGQSNVTILINGKTTRYMDVQSLLRDMPGDNVEKVEVIHQPGSEFEASGTGPVINIILKKNSLYGTNGNVSVGLGRGQNWKYQTALSLSHYQGNVNINGGIGFRDSPYFESLEITRKINGVTYEQLSVDPNFSKTFRSNLAVDWDITNKHRIGFSSRFKTNRRDNIVSNNTDITYTETKPQEIQLETTNINDNDWTLYSVNPYYTFEIDTNGQKIELDFSYANFFNNGITNQSNEVITGGASFPGQRFLKKGDTYITATKLDYHLPINKLINTQFGAKYSYANLDNNFEAFDENETGDFIKNILQSNQFLFSERIMAVYGKMNWQKNKWNGTIGLRYEDSYSEGQSVQVDTILDRSIKKLFPSFSIGREIKGPIGATVAYSYRVDRPNYSSLNPFRFYLDPFTYNAGNPMLRPALTHSAKFNLTYEKQPFFNVEYKQSRDAIVDIIDQNDELGTTNQTTLNLDKYWVFNTSLFFPLDFIPKISGYSGVIANYSNYESELRNTDFLRSRWSITSFISANFTLPGDINTEVSGWYNSGEIDGILTGSWLYGVDIGMSKKVLKNKGKISLGVENLFYRPFYGTIEYSTIDLQVISRWDAPVVNAKFSYKFGNQHMKKKSSVGGSGDDMINRAQ